MSEIEYSVRVGTNGILARAKTLEEAKMLLKHFREERGFKEAAIWQEEISFRYSDGTPAYKAGTLKRVEKG